VELALRAHESLTLEGSVTLDVAVSRDAVPLRAAAASAPRVDRASSSKAARYTLGAATLALTAGAIVTGIVALQKRDNYHDRNRDDVAMSEKLQLRSAATTWGWVSTALGGAAIAAAGTFVYLTFVPASDQGSAGVQLTATGVL
jgi:hypothetical protein